MPKINEAAENLSTVKIENHNPEQLLAAKKTEESYFDKILRLTAFLGCSYNNILAQVLNSMNISKTKMSPSNVGTSFKYSSALVIVETFLEVPMFKKINNIKQWVFSKFTSSPQETLSASDTLIDALKLSALCLSFSYVDCCFDKLSNGNFDFEKIESYYDTELLIAAAPNAPLLLLRMICHELIIHKILSFKKVQNFFGMEPHDKKDVANTVLPKSELISDEVAKPVVAPANVGDQAIVTTDTIIDINVPPVAAILPSENLVITVEVYDVEQETLSETNSVYSQPSTVEIDAVEQETLSETNSAHSQPSTAEIDAVPWKWDVATTSNVNDANLLTQAQVISSQEVEPIIKPVVAVANKTETPHDIISINIESIDNLDDRELIINNDEDSSKLKQLIKFLNSVYEELTNLELLGTSTKLLLAFGGACSFAWIAESLISEMELNSENFVHALPFLIPTELLSVVSSGLNCGINHEGMGNLFKKLVSPVYNFAAEVGKKSGVGCWNALKSVFKSTSLDDTNYLTDADELANEEELSVVIEQANAFDEDLVPIVNSGKYGQTFPSEQRLHSNVAL